MSRIVDKNYPANMAGLKINKLTIVDIAYYNKKTYQRYWNCICDCGTKKIINGQNIRTGDSKSCGCLKGAPRRENNGQWCGYKEISGDFWCQIKAGAKKRNIEFNITIEYMWDLFIKQNGKCALSGIDLCFEKMAKNRNVRTASIDRIDSSKGYVEGNVQWVHKKVNVMKRAMTDEEFVDWCRLIVNHVNFGV